MVFNRKEVIIGTGKLRIGEGFVQFNFSCLLDFLPDTSTSTDLSARRISGHAMCTLWAAAFINGWSNSLISCRMNGVYKCIELVIRD